MKNVFQNVILYDDTRISVVAVLNMHQEFPVIYRLNKNKLLMLKLMRDGKIHVSVSEQAMAI